MRTTVIVITNNPKETLRYNLGWLKDILEIADIIIFDSGSADGMAEYLAACKLCHDNNSTVLAA